MECKHEQDMHEFRWLKNVDESELSKRSNMLKICHEYELSLKKVYMPGTSPLSCKLRLDVTYLARVF